MKIGSLCSGYGGLDLAVEQVTGATSVWHAEFDAAASKVLERRWPGVPNLYDLTVIDWDAVEPVDILTAGYPCQPFSAAGKRKGEDDERHLWPYVREAIRRVRPRFTFLENVAGHRSLGFDRVLGDLAEDGMHVWWTSVRASDVGAPHSRERLFIVVSPDPEGIRWGMGDTANIGETDREVDSPGDSRVSTSDPNGTGGEALWRRPGGGDARRPQPLVSSDTAVDLLPTPRATRGGSATETVELLPTPRATDGTKGGPNQHGSSGDLMLPSAVCQLLPTPKGSDGSGGKHNSEGHADSLPGSIRLLPTPKSAERDDCASEHQRNDPDLRAITFYTQQWGKYETAIRRWEQVTRTAPPPTEPNSKGNPRLSAAFAEWMMGLPAGWVTDVPGISRNDQLRIIGNGVVPQQAVAALRWLLSVSEAAA